MNETLSHFVPLFVRVCCKLEDQAQVHWYACELTVMRRHVSAGRYERTGFLDADADRFGPVQPPDPVERIVAVCPSCDASLSVRRIYIGLPIVCKQCQHTFLLRDETAEQAESLGREQARSLEPRLSEPGIWAVGGNSPRNRSSRAYGSSTTNYWPDTSNFKRRIVVRPPNSCSRRAQVQTGRR